MHIGHIRAQGCYLHCARAYPSYTGVHTVCVAPESTTSPVALPLANLRRQGEEGQKRRQLYTNCLGALCYKDRMVTSECSTLHCIGDIHQ